MRFEEIGKEGTDGNRWIPMVVVCFDAGDEPAIVETEVDCSEDDFDFGEHYDMAIRNALSRGYQKPAISYVPDEWERLMNRMKQMGFI